MENTIVLANAAKTVPGRGTGAKTGTSASKNTADSTQYIDPYLQMLMGFIGQPQTEKSNQAQNLETVTESSAAKPVTPQEMLRLMLQQSSAASQGNQTAQASVAQGQEQSQTQTEATAEQNTAVAQAAQGTQTLQASQDSGTAGDARNIAEVLNITYSAAASEAPETPSETNEGAESVRKQVPENAQSDGTHAQLSKSESNSMATGAPQSEAKNEAAQESRTYQAVSEDTAGKGEGAAQGNEEGRSVNPGELKKAQSGTQSLNAATEKTGTAADAAPTVVAESTKQKTAFSDTIKSEFKTEEPSQSAEKSERIDFSADKESAKASDRGGEQTENQTDGKKGTAGDTDIAKLPYSETQSSTTAGTPGTSATTEKNAGPKLTEQISEGVNRNLSSGKDEFTIKLKPESLGEITLKLVKEDGRTTLSITTTSMGTAKLINDELPALKAAVAQMNIHVSEAVAHTGESQQSGMQFGSMTQQFAGQQGQSGQTSTHHPAQAYSYAEGGTAQDKAKESRSGTYRSTGNGSLNTYI